MPTTADEALFAVLAEHAGLAALLGTEENFRCYPVEAPPGVAAPFLVYQAIGTQPATTHGEGSTDSRLDGVLYQLTAIAATALAAAGIIYQARLAIEESATLKAVMTDERGVPRSEEADVHGKSADFHIWHYPDA